MTPDRTTVEKSLDEACEELYRHAKRYIDEKAHERTIVAAVILPFLTKSFPTWSVDPDYNREGAKMKRNPKKDLHGKLIVPDIVVHEWGPNGRNLVAAQVKGYWNKEDRAEDEDKLRRLAAKHHYSYLYRIELGKDDFEIIPVFE